jgi:anaerobic magnesium-protoporphyrin IX monomethyl ester cyclase
MIEPSKRRRTFPSSARTLLIFPRAFEPNELPPLGILQLAACLKQAGHEVDLLDLTVDSIRNFDISNYCLVGMTLLCTNFRSGTRLAKRIRESSDSVWIAGGGPFADACPQEVLGTSVFDLIGHGECETVLPKLVNALKRGDDIDDVPGLSFWREGKVVRTASPPALQCLDELPFPAYDLLAMSKYTRHSIMASRGCPFDCIFCDRGPTETRKVRYMTSEAVVDRMARLVHEFGNLPIRILDSTFTLNQRWAERICDLILERRLRISWHCQTRIDCVNSGLLEKMKAAGCSEVVVGVDSGNDEILRLSKKRLTKEEARRGAKIFKECSGPKLHINFVIGHPWDTRESIDETLTFARELERDFGARAGFYLMVPFPGTELWDNAKTYGIEIKKDWEKYCKLSFTEKPESLSATFDSKYLKADELTSIYHEIYRRKRKRLSEGVGDREINCGATRL